MLCPFMNKQKIILILALIGFNACISWGQNLTQQLRGTIVDRQTKNVLADASVMIKDAKLNFLRTKIHRSDV